MRSLHFPLKLALPAAIAVIATGAVAVAAIPGADGTIDGCYMNSGPNKGAVRVVSDGTNCKSNETAISWNQRGQKGDTGAAGAAGAKGDQGATGPKGDTGLAGSNGQNGVDGPQGVAGINGPQGLTGPKGDTGNVGPQGPQGATGPQGPAGPAGANGSEALTLGGQALSDGRADAYLKFGDSLPDAVSTDGESVAKGFEKWIEIKSMNFSVTNETTIGSSTGGAGAGKTTVGLLHITKLVDRSTAGILTQEARGGHWKTATIVFRDSRGTIQTLTFGLVFVDKYEQGGKAEPPLLENIDLAFGQYFSSYQPYDFKTGAPLPKVASGWDVTTNKAITDVSAVGTGGTL